MPKRSEREDILSELEGVIKYSASDTFSSVGREENGFPGNLQDDLLLHSILLDYKRIEMSHPSDVLGRKAATGKLSL